MPVVRGKGGLLRIRPGIQLQPQIPGQGLGEARLAGLGRPGQAEQQFGQPIRLRQGAVGVQAEADLRFLEFAEIAISGFQPGLQGLLPSGFLPGAGWESAGS